MRRKHRKFALTIEGEFPEDVTAADIQTAVMFDLWLLSYGLKHLTSGEFGDSRVKAIIEEIKERERDASTEPKP